MMIEPHCLCYFYKIYFTFYMHWFHFLQQLNVLIQLEGSDANQRSHLKYWITLTYLV